jgi:hypothetical protein
MFVIDFICLFQTINSFIILILERYDCKQLKKSSNHVVQFCVRIEENCGGYLLVRLVLQDEINVILRS